MSSQDGAIERSAQERTRLAWQRTVLAAAVCTALVVRVSSSQQTSALRWLLGALIAASGVALLGRRFSRGPGVVGLLLAVAVAGAASVWVVTVLLR